MFNGLFKFATAMETHLHEGHVAVDKHLMRYAADGVLIGMGSTLLDHCDIGEGAVVAAGALVLQNSLDPRTGKTNTITVFKQNRAALASNPIMNSVFAKLKQYME